MTPSDSEQLWSYNRAFGDKSPSWAIHGVQQQEVESSTGDASPCLFQLSTHLRFCLLLLGSRGQTLSLIRVRGC